MPRSLSLSQSANLPAPTAVRFSAASFRNCWRPLLQSLVSTTERLDVRILFCLAPPRLRLPLPSAPAIWDFRPLFFARFGLRGGLFARRLRWRSPEQRLYLPLFLAARFSPPEALLGPCVRALKAVVMFATPAEARDAAAHCIEDAACAPCAPGEFSGAAGSARGGR